MQKKILLVEDDIELLDLLCFNVKKAGFAAATAHDGIEAIKKARSVRPDLILLDLMLLDLDGFAVCETLRRDPSTASIPVIMLTALSGALARVAGFEAGAQDYLTNPFSPRILMERIYQVLESGNTGTAQAATI